MNRRFRDFILALCVMGAIGCMVAQEFVPQHPLHSQLGSGAEAFAFSAIVVWILL